MTTDGLERVMDRLCLLFPHLRPNNEARAEIVRTAGQFQELSVMRAIDEYLTLGEKFLNCTQLFAIAYRLDRQERERADAADKATRAAGERGSVDRHKSRLNEADKLIAEMTDEDVLREWTPMLNGMSGKPREWAEKWPLAKVRTNIFLRTKIAELLTK